MCVVLSVTKCMVNCAVLAVLEWGKFLSSVSNTIKSMLSMLFNSYMSQYSPDGSLYLAATVSGSFWVSVDSVLQRKVQRRTQGGVLRNEL